MALASLAQTTIRRLVTTASATPQQSQPTPPHQNHSPTTSKAYTDPTVVGDDNWCQSFVDASSNNLGGTSADKSKEDQLKIAVVMGATLFLITASLTRLWMGARKTSRREMRQESRRTGCRLYAIIILVPLLPAVLGFVFEFSKDKFNNEDNYEFLYPAYGWLVATPALWCYLQIMVLSCGGANVIQESLEVAVYAHKNHRLGWKYCSIGLSSTLWGMFKFHYYCAFLIMLQPVPTYIMLYLRDRNAESSQTEYENYVKELEWLFVVLDVLLTIIPLRNTWTLLKLCEQAGSRLPKLKLKYFYIAGIVVFSQLQWTLILFSLDQKCSKIHFKDYKFEIMEFMTFVVTIEMAVMAVLALLVFNFSDFSRSSWGLLGRTAVHDPQGRKSSRGRISMDVY